MISDPSFKGAGNREECPRRGGGGGRGSEGDCAGFESGTKTEGGKFLSSLSGVLQACNGGGQACSTGGCVDNGAAIRHSYSAGAGHNDRHYLLIQPPLSACVARDKAVVTAP